MKFLALLITLAIAMLFPFRPLLHRDAFFIAFRDWMARHAPSEPGSTLSILLGALLPALLIALLLALLQGWLLGLVGLVADCAILLYSLERRDLLADLSRYRLAWSRGDAHAAWRIAIEARLLPTECTPTTAIELNRLVAQGIAVRALSGLFTLLFWFFLLGPAAVLFLRLIQLPTAESGVERLEPGSASGRLLELAQWLPMRLLGGCFMLAGDWGRAWPCWSGSLTDFDSSAADLIGRLALAAAAIDQPLDLSDAVSLDSEPSASAAVVKTGNAQIEAMTALLRRGLIIWVTLFALLTLLG